MEFKTSISKISTKDQDVIIRGKKLSDLIENHTFSDSIFLLLKGSFPNEKESIIFSAMLTSIIDHGMGTTSSLTTRFVTSGGNSLNTAVGAGVLALGDYHGGAIEKAMEQISNFSKEFDNLEDVIQRKLVSKEAFFGFGHKIYKNNDPRVKIILNKCEHLDYRSQYLDTLLRIESLIEQIKGKKIIINIDGLIAALLLSMGFHSTIGKGIFIIGRISGLVAQSVEEKENEKPVRRISEEEIYYKE